MGIVILEDRPWVMKNNIINLQQRGVTVHKILYYCERDDRYNKSINRINELEDELNLEITRVTSFDFEEKLDQIFNFTTSIFLFDMDLVGDFSKHFQERINVMYAEDKRENGNGDRIWFYTTGPDSAKEQLMTYFPDRVVPVLQFDTEKEMVIMDIDFVVNEIPEVMEG